MPNIFNTQPGRVGLVVTTEIAPMVFGIQSWAGPIIMRAIITSIGINRQSGAQFAHSLQDKIYVYTFGERIADLVISGVGFANVCKAIPDTIFGNVSGLETTNDFFNTVNICNSGIPVLISLGVATIIQAFLIGYSYKIMETETALGQFNYSFKYSAARLAPRPGLQIFRDPVNTLKPKTRTISQPPNTVITPIENPGTTLIPAPDGAFV